MSAALAILASLSLASSPAEHGQDVDKASLRFANTLVTAYSCDLLGYGVDYAGLADWGHEAREAIMSQGATYDEALNRIRADVRLVRQRFNTQYYSAIYRTRFNFEAADVFGSSGAQERFQRTFTKRCDSLVDDDKTSAMFTRPQKRMSSAEVSRKVRDLVVLARHGA